MINSNQFVIKAKDDGIDFYGWNILIDDYLTVDKSIEPENGDVVLVNNNIRKWDGLQKVNGVIVYTGRAKVRPTESMTVEAGHD